MMKQDKIMLAQDNKLTMSRYDFTPIEKRCLYYVIKEVRRLYVENDRDEHDIAYKNIFEDMFLFIPADKLKLLGDEEKDVYNALKRLQGRQIEIENKEMWLVTSWVLLAKHERKTDKYKVQVSGEIMPYLVELASKFTEYNLTVAIALKSTYSQRIYEMCCQYRNKGKFFMEIDKLRYLLKIENKKTYDNVANIKRKILDIAQKELKDLYDREQCDLYFTYRPKDTKGRKILSYWFDIYTKEDEEQKQIEFITTQEQTRRILAICGTFIKHDSKYLKRIEKALLINPDNVREILDKLTQKVEDYPKDEIAPIIRYILREDYNIF